MPTISFVTKVDDQGVVKTFESIDKSIGQADKSAAALGNTSAAASQKMAVDWKQVSATLDGLGAQLTQTGQTLSLGLTAPIVALGAVAVTQFSESAKAIALMENAIRSTGDASGKTSKQLQDMATSLQNNSLFEDDTIIQKVITQLLTFTNVSGEAFDRGAQAALNMSTVLGQDLQSSAIQVGKALNDPIEGVSALQRVGVKLTDDQKALVKSFMDVNDIAGAQGVILSELEKEFGGAAEAASKAGTGPFKQLQIQIGNLTEEFGGLIVKALVPIVGHLSDAVKWIDSLSESQKETILIVAGLAAAIGPLLIILGTMASGLASIITVVTSVSGVIAGAGGLTAVLGIFGGGLTAVAAIITGPVGIVVAIGAAVVALGYFIDKTEAGHQLISTAWNAIKDLASTVWSGITSAVRSAADAILKLWNDNKDSLMETWKALSDAAKAVWDVIGPYVILAVKALALEIETAMAAIKAAWSLVWGEIGTVVSTAWDLISGMVSSGLQIIRGVLEVFTGLLTLDWSKFTKGLSDIWQGLWNEIKTILTAPLELVSGSVKNFTSSVTGFFGDMYNAVVGHSFVPDMITGIGEWFGRLPDLMVNPAKDSNQKVKDSFSETFDTIIAGAQAFASQVGGIVGDAVNTAVKAGGQFASGDYAGGAMTIAQDQNLYDETVHAFRDIGAGRRTADLYIEEVQKPLEQAMAQSQYWTLTDWNNTYKKWNADNATFIRATPTEHKDEAALVEKQAAATLNPVFDQIYASIMARSNPAPVDQMTRESATATTGLFFDFQGGTGWNNASGPMGAAAPIVAPAAVTMTGVDPWADFNQQVTRFQQEQAAGTLVYSDALDHINNLRTISGELNDPAATDFIGSFISDMEKVAAGLDHSHIGGLDYVPYDNYPAMLHKGERVQTAAQARAGGGGGINVTINGGINVTGAASDDADTLSDKMITAFVRKLRYSGELQQTMGRLTERRT